MNKSPIIGRWLQKLRFARGVNIKILYLLNKSGVHNIVGIFFLNDLSSSYVKTASQVHSTVSRLSV